MWRNVGMSSTVNRHIAAILPPVISTHHIFLTADWFVGCFTIISLHSYSKCSVFYSVSFWHSLVMQVLYLKGVWYNLVIMCNLTFSTLIIVSQTFISFSDHWESSIGIFQISCSQTVHTECSVYDWDIDLNYLMFSVGYLTSWYSALVWTGCIRSEQEGQNHACRNIFSLGGTTWNTCTHMADFVCEHANVYFNKFVWK